MPIYTYKAKKGPGEVVEGEIDAPSQDDAVTRLEGMGLVPVSVATKDEGRRTKDDGRIVHRPSSVVRRSVSQLIRVKAEDLTTFTRQLTSLIKSGVSVLGALSLISQETQNKALKDVVSDMEKEVKDGSMLSEAMEKYPKIFKSLYLSMVKAGEKGGVLDETLTRLADHMEKEEDFRRRIQAAMAYPLLIITVGIGTIFIMLTYFLPKA